MALSTNQRDSYVQSLLGSFVVGLCPCIVRYAYFPISDAQNTVLGRCESLDELVYPGEITWFSPLGSSQEG